MILIPISSLVPSWSNPYLYISPNSVCPFSFNNLLSSLWVVYMLMGHLLLVVDLSGPHPFIKVYLSSPEVISCPYQLDWRWGPMSTSHSMQQCLLSWPCADLLQEAPVAVSSWVQWSWYVQKTLLGSGLFQTLTLTVVLFHLPWWSWDLVEGEYKCAISIRVSHWRSPLWPAMNFYLDQHWLHQEVSLIRTESYTTLMGTEEWIKQ
jgi:hypothetical protein